MFTLIYPVLLEWEVAGNQHLKTKEEKKSQKDMSVANEVISKTRIMQFITILLSEKCIQRVHLLQGF